ncbi:MAG TPA: cytochrome c biogenesis protein CcsA [Fimbriimonadaceae bacterium]|nr:cytochrome c biogenesis protein CcsA [Fimbriimonadaceae bacterium]
MKNWRFILFIVAALASVAYSLLAPPAQAFQDPSLARLIFFHLPCAFIATGFIVLSAWFGFRYLSEEKMAFDARNAATTELGAIFAALTMATGVLFSKFQWGQWWQNDPRQTSFLIVLLLCAAGVALRAGVSDEQKAAKASAAYSVATVLPGLFLIFVLPRILQSFHPSNTIVSGGFSGAYWAGIFLAFVVMVAAARTLYVERTQKELSKYGHSDPSDSPSPYPRRPVAVSKIDQGQE